MSQVSEKPKGREAQRLETRQRVFTAAVAEFKRVGVADADVGAIVAAAGVARGTFYFHFPTKEHVLEEVERNLVVRLAAELEKYLSTPRELWSSLAETVRLVVAAESRLGARLFKDVLAMHFSSTRPPGWGKATDHPLVAQIAAEIERARVDGVVHAEADPVNGALFFLLGVYALLVTNHEAKPARARVIDVFLASTRRGLECR